MNIKIYLDRYIDAKYVDEAEKKSGTQFEQNATMIKLDFSALDFLDDECVKTIHFFHDDLSEENYIGDSIIQNDEFKIPKSITEYENVLAFVQITKSDFIWKTKSFDLHFNQSLDVDKTLDEDQIGILQELILEVQQIKTDTADEYKQLAEEEIKKFNDNATAKTNTFNSNATSKLEKYNSNATSKETSYNENATTKLNEYNENHTSKLTAYNENSAEKLAEYNENAAEKIAEYDEHIEELDNIVSKNVANGESIYIDDALKYKVFNAKIDGNAEQTTTTGKNYFNALAINNTAIVVENDGQTITIDVVASGNGAISTHKTLAELCPNLTAGDQVVLRFNRNLGNTYNNFIYLGVPVAETWKNGTSKTITEEMLGCEVQLYGNRYIDGETEQCIITDFTIMKSSETDTTFEPFTNNEPSPNPDYPQEIETLSFKNVLNIPDQVITNSGCTFTFENGICTIAGTATADEIYCIIENLNLILKAGTYTYSSGLNYPYPYFSIYYNDSFKQISVYDDNGVKTFEIDEDIIVTQVRFYFSKGSMSNIQKFTPQIEKGSTATEFVKYENIGILQVGKNLFNTANKEYSLASLDINISNNELLINGTSTGSTGRFVIADNLNIKTSNYIFSFFANNIIPNLTFEFYDLEDNLCKFESANNKTNGSIVIQNHSIKKISAYSNNVQTFSHEIKLQIEEGTVSTDYEEYKSNEYTIDLQDNELVKLTDDIKDTIEIDKSGNVSLNKSIRHLSLAIADMNNSSTFPGWKNLDILKEDYPYENDLLSSIVSFKSNISNHYNAFGINTNGASGTLFFRRSFIPLTQEEWLAQYPELILELYYSLKNAETVDLGTIQNFKTFEGINHFFLEANLSTNFEIKYAQDLQKAISKQQEEIDELKTLLSSTATSALLLDNYANDLMEEV